MSIFDDAPGFVESNMSTLAKRIEQRYPGLANRLGKENNAVLARKYNISRERVRQIRRDLGLPSCYQALDAAHKEMIKRIRPLAGKFADAEIAARLSLTTSLVGRLRRSIAMPAFGSGSQTRDLVIQKASHRLGKESDCRIAKDLGINISSVQRIRVSLGIKSNLVHHRFNPIDRGALRQMFLDGKADEEIAEALDSTILTVKSIRHELGLRRRG